MSGALEVAGGLEAQPHWAQVQGPSTPTVRGVGGIRGIRRPAGV